MNDEGGFTLPSIHIHPDRRLAEQANREVKDKFGLTAYCLFPKKSETRVRSYINYSVMECRSETTDQPRFGSWVPIASLKEQRFAEQEQRSAVFSTLHDIDAYQSGAMRGPFARPGWMDELRSWVEEQLPNSLHLTGDLQQFNAHPTFSLVRLETNASAIWFKAVGEPNLREFPITLTLSDLLPQFVAEVIASRLDWNGWLTMEFEGKPLHSQLAPHLWQRAGAVLADLQSASADQIDRLLAAGCHDLRCGTLLRLVDPFMETMFQLMKEQVKMPPVPLDEQELRELGVRLKEAIASWAELEIPDTLGNLDLNPENLLLSEKRCAFLDWADAYVGPPFLTFEYLLGIARRLNPDCAGLEPELVNCYSKYWRSFVSTDAIVKARTLAPLLAAFSYAAGTEIWRDPARIRNNGVAGYLRSLTRRMQHEAKSYGGAKPSSVRC